MSTAVAASPADQKHKYTPRSAFIRGARDTIPMILGAIPFGILFGALGISAGMSPMAVIGFSLFVFAGSSQFIGANLIGQGVAIPFIVITTFIVNLRHALYAASLGPYVKHLPQRWLIPLAFWLTDETYAVVIRNYQESQPHAHWYHLGSSIAMYTNWNMCTWIGIIAGTQFKGLAESGLDFAMVVTFIGIVVPLVINRPMLVCALVSGITALITFPMPNKIGLIIAAAAGIIAGYVVESMQAASTKKEKAA
jgi:4-azaleucine resistance transporter AzlC